MKKTDPETFDSLQKLLALKRREMPPPGYFQYLPGKVVWRIERGEGQLGFWERFSSSFTMRPAFAYAFAMAALGAFSASIFYSGAAKDQDAQAQNRSETAWANASTGSAAAFATQNEFSPTLHVANWLGNTNPGAPPQVLPSLFAPHGHAVMTSFETGN
ncbi:MAG: hypothetical protein ACLQVY_11015 [Limisphaerales bacterium]